MFLWRRAFGRSAPPPTDEDVELDDDELQRRVLESTLDEIAAADEEAECCVICLDTVSDPCEVVPCGHKNFDYTCAASWFAIHPSCPLCKANVRGLLHGRAHRRGRPLTKIGALQREYRDHQRQREQRQRQERQETQAQERREWRRRQMRETRQVAGVSEPTPRFLDTMPRGSSVVVIARPDVASARTLAMATPRTASRPPPRPVPTVVTPPSATPESIRVRRDVYAHARFSLHVGSNRVSQYRELTPAMFCADAHLVSRARMFIRRELQVFTYLSNDDRRRAQQQQRPGDSGPLRAMSAAEERRARNAEFLLEYVVAILKSVDIMGAMGSASDMLSDFLGWENARLFLHELRAWLRSPYERLEDWDRNVQYGPDLVMPETRVPRPEPEGSMSPMSPTSSRTAASPRQAQRQEDDVSALPMILSSTTPRQPPERIPGPRNRSPPREHRRSRPSSRRSARGRDSPARSRAGSNSGDSRDHRFKGDFYRPGGRPMMRWIEDVGYQRTGEAGPGAETGRRPEPLIGTARGDRWPADRPRIGSSFRP